MTIEVSSHRASTVDTMVWIYFWNVIKFINVIHTMFKEIENKVFVRTI